MSVLKSKTEENQTLKTEQAQVQKSIKKSLKLKLKLFGYNCRH